MATYGAWTEQREYRVSAGDDFWQVTTVLKHKNGWYSVETDGYDVPYKTRSEREAYDCAQQRTETGEREASEACPCAQWDAQEREECESGTLDTWGHPHGVSTDVIDHNEGRTLEPYEL